MNKSDEKFVKDMQEYWDKLHAGEFDFRVTERHITASEGLVILAILTYKAKTGQNGDCVKVSDDQICDHVAKFGAKMESAKVDEIIHHLTRRMEVEVLESGNVSRINADILCAITTWYGKFGSTGTKLYEIKLHPILANDKNATAFLQDQIERIDRNE